jgi:hypothetical protein
MSAAVAPDAPVVAAPPEPTPPKAGPDAELLAELLAHADTEAVKAAEAVLAQAQERMRAAQAAAAAADAEASAKSELPALVEVTYDGSKAVTPQVVAALRQKIRDAEAHASFTSAVVKRHADAVGRARDELDETKHRAWLPVFNAMITVRIEIARKVDRAILASDGGRDRNPAENEAIRKAREAAFEALRPRFEAAREAYRVALRSGLRAHENRFLAQEPSFPAREASERAWWGRAMSVEEFLAATRD